MAITKMVNFVYNVILSVKLVLSLMYAQLVQILIMKVMEIVYYVNLLVSIVYLLHNVNHVSMDITYQEINVFNVHYQ